MNAPTPIRRVFHVRLPFEIHVPLSASAEGGRLVLGPGAVTLQCSFGAISELPGAQAMQDANMRPAR